MCRRIVAGTQELIQFTHPLPLSLLPGNEAGELVHNIRAMFDSVHYFVSNGLPTSRENERLREVFQDHFGVQILLACESLSDEGVIAIESLCGEYSGIARYMFVCLSHSIARLSVSFAASFFEPFKNDAMMIPIKF